MAEAGERAMVAPERHWRMQRTSSQRQDEGATACRLDQLRAPAWAGSGPGWGSCPLARVGFRCLDEKWGILQFNEGRNSPFMYDGLRWGSVADRLRNSARLADRGRVRARARPHHTGDGTDRGARGGAHLRGTRPAAANGVRAPPPLHHSPALKTGWNGAAAGGHTRGAPALPPASTTACTGAAAGAH